VHEGFEDVQLAGIVEDVPDALVIVDRTGTIVFANSAVADVLAYEPDQLLGEHLSLLIPEDVRARHAVQFEGFMREPTSRPMGVGLELRARRRDGSLIPVEVALVPLRSAERTAAFVRDVSERRRLIDRLMASNELTSALASGASRDEAIALGVRRARQLLGGNDAWLALTDPTTGAVDVVIGSEERPVETDTFIADVGASAPRVVVDHVAAGRGWDDRLAATGASPPMDGPWMVAPFGTPHRGTLVVTRPPGSVPFDDADEQSAEQLATEIGVALDLLDARAAADRVSLMAEHERIARDLHDTVIQTVFAEGLRLQGTAQLAEGPVAERIQRSVDNLDSVIREIRTAIFQLQNTEAGERGLRTAVLELTDEMTEPANLRARVALGGSVEARTPEALGEALLVVLREALSNVVRHASASSVDVVIDVEDDVLCLTVSDDGVGPPDHPTAGLGLVSLQARAIELGGSFTIRAGQRGGEGGSGTVIRWLVPLADAQ
jgi:PAS domain S-box-containing protein